MRRHLPIAALLGILALTAGCSGDDSPGAGTPSAAAPSAPAGPSEGSTEVVTPGGASATSAPAGGGKIVSSSGPVDPAAAAASAVALGGGTKVICEQAGRASTGFGETYIADLKLQISAAADNAAKAKAEKKIAADVQVYSDALAKLAKLATEPDLKKALTTISKEVVALKGDVTKINAEKMAQLTGRLDKACGKG